MICFKLVNKYCCEDPRLIENYEKAVNDESQTWHIHHRLETDLGLSANELKEQNRYFNAPASELIFMTHSEHVSLHSNERWGDPKERQKQSEILKGEKNPMYNKQRSEETRKKQSISMKGKLKGEKNPMYGKNAEDYMSEEAIKEKRQKQRQSHLGKTPWNKGMTKEEMKNYKKK